MLGMALLADLGVRIGSLPTGRTNSVIDVPGVGLGHSTVVYDDAPPPFGRGVARTGVTVIDFGGDTWSHPVVAGVSVLNGAGELTARSQVDEWGLLETPVFLTSTMQVGRVYDAACRLLMAEQERIGVDDVIIPAVGECDDSWLNDPRHMHVTDEHVAAALAAARASAGSPTAPEQGAVGAGMGMSVFDHKGGIGTSSRVLSDGHVVGVVLLTNFGSWDRLTVDGVAVGQALGRPSHVEPPPAGSCLGVVVTDAPIDHSGCERLARRVGLGLARTGSVATHGSGEIFLAAALGLRAPRETAPTGVPLTGRDLNEYFAAVVDASEEAVLASMLAAHDVTGREGRTIPALPVEAVRRILSEGRRP
jgi:D-aminopeptidase